jgi:hypothetical protein
MTTSPSRTGFLDRRTLLKGMGAVIALPWLESLHAADPATGGPAHPRCMINLTHKFGMYAPTFHPLQEGADYEMTDGLRPLERHRRDLTIFKNLGLSVTGGHAAAPCILSDMKRTEANAHPDGGITVDARAAELHATATRFPLLNLWGNPDNDQHTSFARSGAKIPYVGSPQELFSLLFVGQTGQEKTARGLELEGNRSVLDTVRESARRMVMTVSTRDRHRLDDYFTAVREAEKKVQTYQDWLSIPKPGAPAGLAERMAAVRKERQTETYDAFIELIPLILETDSSRIITIDVFTNPNWNLPGISDNYHSLTHHGQLPDKVRQLRLIDDFHLSRFAMLIDRVKALGMLDSTQLLYSSGMSDGNGHSNQNLPIILAGGGFRHGTMIDVRGRQPLSNLYLSMLQRHGVETTAFNKSTGTMRGLA